VAVWLLLPALAKFNIVPVWGACETIPDPETVKAVPADTSTVWPAAVVNVAVPVPLTLTLTPHSSGRIPGWQGMMIISTTVCAIADADESINKPAKTKALVQPCLFTGKLSSIYSHHRTKEQPHQLSADTQCPIRRFDLIHFLILLTGHKSERSLCCLDDVGA
jgi:hypothetical protein